MSSETFPEGVGTAVDYDPFADAPLARVVPATEPQREIWLAATLDNEASLAYNEAATLRLRGTLDIAALRGALQALVDRHEALRGSVSPNGEEFCIAEHVDLACPLRDLAALPATARAHAVDETLQRVVREPFDLEHGPLVRAELLRLGADEHVLVLTAHHIVCDGWSFGVVVRDLGALYAQMRGGPAPAAADSFADFALAEAAHAGSAESSTDASYWLARFAGPAPILDLPTDRPRPARRTFASRRIDVTIDKDLATAVKATGAKHRASLYATLVSAFGALLHRLTGSDDIVVGIPAAGQAAGGHDALIGHCVNVLPLRIAIDGDSSFADLVARVRGDLLDAFDHQQFALGELLRQLALPRDPARLPLVSVLFNLDQALDESTIAFADLAYEFQGVARAFENFELFVNAVQTDSGLRLECQYNTDLFDAATIEAWLYAYVTLLRSVVAEPGRVCAALELLSAEASARLEALQPAATPFDAMRLAHGYFEAQVDRSPQRAAARHAQTRWSYADLETRANAIAHALRARGARRGTLVGLCIGRGVDMIAVVLGAMKSGAGYVPLDPAFPIDRLAFMSADAGLVALVVDEDVPAGLDVAHVALLSLRNDAQELAAAATMRLPLDEAAAAPDSVAYVIYTSGSTGKPKGVRVPHRSTSNFLTAMQRVPGIVEDDRLVAVTTLSFDIAFMELMLPLCIGAEVIIADRDDARDGIALRALVESSAATMLQATPSGWRILIESGWQGHAGFKAVSGGEPLSLDLAEALLQRCGEVWNGYGPTETTVYSTYWRVDNPRNGISIGQPIANTTVRVLDTRGASCPLGVPGELYIGGAGVTLGYLNRPELDSERFVPDPFAAPGARRYRTGDRGRWLANGRIEHLGRLDFQVKVRGYRIELGEIEANLAALIEVARAAVLAREDRPGDVRLVAYLVAASGHAISESAVRAQLKNVLPDYMIPQHVVALDALPLLPNGKLDRGALPAPVAPAPSAGTYRAPRNDIEQRIAQAMEATLSLPGIGIDDDFFALGGHSLLAAQLTARLNREFAVALSFRTLFDAPSVLGLSHAIEAASAQPSPPVPAIERRAERMHAPLSRMQERLWLLEELHPGRVVYNTPSAHRLAGALDEHAFEQAFKDMIARQESLRTSIARRGDDVVQLIHANLPLTLFPAEDLSTLPAQTRESELMARLDALTNAPFDLTEAPLFRARMFRLGAEHYVLFFMPHHIIWDGWSFDIFYEEIAELYAARKEARAPQLATLPISYGDFAIWHRDWMGGPEYARQLDYWRGLLRSRPAANVLPTDMPRRPGMSGEGRTEWISLPRETVDALRELGRRADATPFMILLALYYALLYRYAGESNLIVGTPVRGRMSTDVEHVMGYFTNLLPLPLDLDPASDFLGLLRRVKALVLDSFANADTQLEDLTRELAVKRGDSGGALLYQALFSFQDARQRARRWGGLSHEQIPLFQRGATEDLGLWFLDHGEGMVGGVIYNADILSRETARSLGARYLALVDRAIAEPDAAIEDLTAADAADLEQIEQWNATAQAFDENARIEALVAAQADAHGERAALTFGSWDTSYAELDQRANRIAACLRARGAKPGIAIGLASQREPNRLAATLAILGLGATCVPLDATDPPEHLKTLIDLAGISLIVGDSAISGELRWPAAKALWFDADTSEIAAAPRERVVAEAGFGVDAASAFIVFTPQPSGALRRVELTHRGLVNALTYLQRTLALHAGNRIIATAPPLSDRVILEWLLPLTAGATLVAANGHEAADGAALMLLASTSDARLMIADPQQWQAMLDAGWTGDSKMLALCLRGQPSRELAARLLGSGMELWCAFGAPETSLLATCGRIDDPAIVHRGVPVANTTVHILDQQLEPCVPGSVGEICIGGIGVAHPDAGSSGAEQFIADRYSAIPCARLFRSGHRGRWLSDGRIEEFGRKDRRVCVRGRWIEPVVVENELLKVANVARAHVAALDRAGGSLELVAYVDAVAGARLDSTVLAHELAARLPASARPSRVVVLDELPTLANGQVDVDAMTRRDRSDRFLPATGDADSPMSPAEVLLADVWRELLGVGEIQPEDNFFDLGGHSLLALSMVAKVEKQTRVRLNLLKIANSNLRALAAELPQVKPDHARSDAPSLGERVRGLFGFGRRGNRE